MSRDGTSQIEFGDFQTPLNLAREVCSLIARSGFYPASVLEPTCGVGNFVQAALDQFPNTNVILGVELNSAYVQQAREQFSQVDGNRRVEIHQADFFSTNWERFLDELVEPALIIGNPPWVTNAALGVLGSANLPAKSNIGELRGIEALTGKSNFDISEWILRTATQWLSAKSGVLAVLCKTAVARKVLLHSWLNDFPIESASIYRVDTKRHFHVSVDACLLVLKSGSGAAPKVCADFVSLEATQQRTVFGLRGGMLVSDVPLYEQSKHLYSDGLSGWRSGIKHDCSSVFEVEGSENGLGEVVDVEDEVLFPMLKSSDVANDRAPRKCMIVPQQSMSDNPALLERSAPKAWQYLDAHRQIVDKRGSSVYRSRPAFSVFGVGPYSFAPWKVAVSGLYKALKFRIVAPFHGRPVVFDDTCYFFPCQSESEALTLHRLVTSTAAIEFWSSLIFWDAKRPITAQTLNLLDLGTLAKALGDESVEARVLSERQRTRYVEGVHQGFLFNEHSMSFRGSVPSDHDEKPDLDP